MSKLDLFNIREVAFLLGEDFRYIAKEMDGNPSMKRILLHSPDGQRVIPHPALIFLQIIGETKGTLSNKGREELFNTLIAHEGREEKFIELTKHFFIDLEAASEEIKSKVDLLNKLREGIEVRGDLHLLRNTEVDVYRVAALASTSTEEALFDFPSLTVPQVELARLYAEIYPKIGRPYSKKSAKKILLGAEFGLLNEEVRNIRLENGQTVAGDELDDEESK